MKGILLIFIWTIALGCFSEADSFGIKPIPFEDGWPSNRGAVFEIPSIEDPQNRRFDLFILIRNDDTYPFQNLFLISTIKDSVKIQSKDTLEYIMANPDGSWMGSGYGSIKESKLVFKENHQFLSSGPNIIEIFQFMRKIDHEKKVDTLFGVIDVGLSVIERSPFKI